MIAPFNTAKSLTVLKKHFRRISASSGAGYRFPAEVPDQNEILCAAWIIGHWPTLGTNHPG
jgi:hypothetical protein